MAVSTRSLAGLLAWCLVLVPATIQLHEAGHWLVARLAGFAPVLHFASVDGIPDQPPFGGAAPAVALASLAGPAVSILLVLTGMMSAARAWAMPLVAAGILRFVINPMFLVQQALVAAGIAEAGAGNFDEIVAARALGWPPAALALPGALVLLLGLVWLWRRASGRQLAVLLAGTVAGVVLWMGALGPILLP